MSAGSFGSQPDRRCSRREFGAGLRKLGRSGSSIRCTRTTLAWGVVRAQGYPRGHWAEGDHLGGWSKPVAED
jgi:hypothetical protein